MKKLLMISPFNIFPPYWGGASRIYNLAKNLAKENKIVLLCNDYKETKIPNINCNEFNELSLNPSIQLHFVKSLSKFSQIFNPLLIIKGLNITRKEKPDLIIGEFAWSGFHIIILHLLSRCPYILDEHNVEFLRFERMKRGNKLTTLLLKIYEKISCKFAYKVFCVSEVDKNFLISKLNVTKNKIMVVPNGIDTDKFYPDIKKREKTREKLKVGQNTPLILFFGKLDYKPNYEAMEIIYKQILPRILERVQNVKFLAVGDNPPLEFSHKNIIFTGVVENIEDYINASDVVICPLLSGGGTRIKILEALACGKIVITTKIGAEGLLDENTNKMLIIADNWDEFTEKIINSINKKIHKPNRDFIERYSWKSIIGVLNAL